MPDINIPACWVTWSCCPSGDCARCLSGTIHAAYREPAASVVDAKKTAARLSAETPGSIGFVYSSHPDTGQPWTCIAEYMHGRDVHAQAVKGFTNG